MAAPVVAIAGLRALRSDLNRMGADANGPLYAVLKRAAEGVAEPIAARTRADLPRGSRTSGALQGTVRMSATKTGASVRMGRASVPWAGWVEFGGGRPDGSAREYRPGGRYMFPAAQNHAPQAAAAYGKALEQVMASTRVWTNTTSSPGSVHD